MRTKALRLLHKQVCKDSSKSGQGFADYMVTMLKPGDNQEPITRPGFSEFIGEDPPSSGKNGNISHQIWRRYASPVWMDIDQGNTLNFRAARANNDERHICPLQLDAIARCLELWSNPGDMVLSPFMGIGSEGFQAVKMGRRFTGSELKETYFNEAVKNMKEAESLKYGELFG